jgi:hypothetical protein
MNACKKTTRNLVAFLCGELEKKDASVLESHLEVCPKCREELRQLKEIYRVADSLNEDMERAASSIDWKALPARMAERIDERQKPQATRSRKKGLWPFLFQPRLRPVYAGLLLGLIAGSLATFLIFRAHFLKMAENGKIVVPQGFYEKMELEMARRETLDYLLGSEYLLLDFVQSSPERSAEFWQSDFAAQKTKDLLSKKKYIDPQLDKFQLAKAKALCDQIELLFFELMQISENLSEEELQMIQNLIEERQLLLKIKLVKKELEKSEV